MKHGMAERIINLAIRRGFIDKRRVELLENELLNEEQPTNDRRAKRSFVREEDAPTEETFIADSFSLNGSEASSVSTPVSAKVVHQRTSDPSATMTSDLDESEVIYKQRLLVSKVGRYEDVEILGEGGMGTVYKAYDPMLQRSVALKFIREDDPKLIQRLLLEGRSQAKIEHPGICKIYEVGQIESHFYIAMQYINGQVLTEAIHELTLVQKLKLMAEVAEALHAAHREGLVHRDIKPQNIMIERSVDGWKPYLMDFGLVRDINSEVESQSITVNGAIVGTPWYMPPEQARGEIENLDRRTDIYSLGATFYELLTGRSPFADLPLAELLSSILTKDAPSIRKYNSAIPIDVETIVMKCLEKEPDRRYDSAKALQADILRYLSGEPVLARRAGFFYKLRKKAQKNKAAAAVMTLALIVAIGIAGWGVKASWQARSQAESLKIYVALIKEIEDTMRKGHQMPLHNMSREREIVRDHMLSVQKTMQHFGASGESAGHYALGCGHLALNETEEAINEFRKAQELGYDSADLSYNLGVALRRIYIKQVSEANSIPNQEEREATKKKLLESYGLLSEKALQTGIKKGTSYSTDYIEAQALAIYDGKIEKALEKADDAIKKIPWLYEAEKLKGDIYLGIAGEEYRQRGDNERTYNLYEKARQSYEKAIEIGESDISLYESLVNYWGAVMVTNFESGRDVQEPFQKILEICDKMALLDPENLDTYLLKARAYTLLGSYKADIGQDPSSEYMEAINFAKSTLYDRKVALSAYILIGRTYYKYIEYLMGSGKDPTSLIEEVVATYEKAINLDKSCLACYNNIGSAYRIEGDYLKSRGKDPQPAYDKAIEYFSNVSKLFPSENTSVAVTVNNNLGIAYICKARHKVGVGEVPTDCFKKGIENFTKVLEVQQTHVPAKISLSSALIDNAVYETSRGTDPTALSDRAIDICKSILTSNPKYAQAYANIAILYRIKASYKLNRGKNPEEEVLQGLENAKQALQLNPKLATAYLETSFLRWIGAYYKFYVGEDPSQAVAASLEEAQKSININPNDFTAYLNSALNYSLMANYQVDIQKSPAITVKNGLNFIREAEKINPSFSMSWTVEGRLLLAQARWELENNISAEGTFKKALATIERARELNSNDADIFSILAEYYRWHAVWLSKKSKDPTKEVESGLEAVERGLAINKNFGELHLTKSALYLIEAGFAKDTKLAEQSLKAAQKAVEANPALERKVKPIRESAQHLLTSQ